MQPMQGEEATTGAGEKTEKEAPVEESEVLPGAQRMVCLLALALEWHQ